MNVYDIEFNDFTGDKTRSILAENMKEAANIADKMLQVSLANLWEDIRVVEIRFVCEITELKEFVSEIEEKGVNLKKEMEEMKNE
jgi:hypothetical protein